MTTWIILGLLILIGLYVITLYNQLVQKRQMVEEGWSGIDVQLKRRADLIPNLVETVKGYATHERGTLEEVTEMRAKAGQCPFRRRGRPAQAKACCPRRSGGSLPWPRPIRT